MNFKKTKVCQKLMTKAKVDELTLSNILGIDAMRNEYLLFCIKDCTKENLLCFELLQNIEKANDFDFWRRAKLTYDTHISTDDVNIHGDIKQAITKLSGRIYAEEARTRELAKEAKKKSK